MKTFRDVVEALFGDQNPARSFVAGVLAGLILSCVVAQGQGQFLFNAHNPATGNDVRFFAECGPVAGPNIFLQVLAGSSSDDLHVLEPLLPLDLVGAGAGYPNPVAQTYTVPGMMAGVSATVGYRYFLGTSYYEASSKSGLELARSPVVLTDGTTAPNEVVLGVSRPTVDGFPCPEPSTWVLLLVGVGALIRIVVTGRLGVVRECAYRSPRGFPFRKAGR